MKTFYFLILFFSTSIFAQEEIWKLGDSFIAVMRDKKGEVELLYSKSCEKKNCEAIVKSENLKWDNLPKDAFDGGKNPGAVLCKEVLKQNIIYVKDISGNENTFCIFKDKSFISSSSLSNIANKNSQKASK
jgi:hypothetical protein